MIDHDRQELTKEKSMKLNDFLQIHSGLNVRSVGKASSIPQITICQIRIEHLLLKRKFVQQLYEDDHVKMLLSLLTELRNKNLF